MDIKLKVDNTTTKQTLERKIDNALNRALRLEKVTTSDDTYCRATIILGSNVNIRTLRKALEQYTHNYENDWSLTRIIDKPSITLVFDYHHNAIAASRL